MARLQNVPLTTLAALTIWVLALGYGFWRMAQYDLTPGARADSPADWPARANPATPSLTLAAGHGAKTLVVFAHPQCPCTRATIGNLATALAHENPASGIFVTFVFYEPRPHAGPDWEQSDLIRSVEEVPNSTVQFDPGGALAKRFGAETSGQVFVYDSFGCLLFSGGVTDERGHFGDSAGGDAIAAIAQGKDPEVRATPVYGCSLLPGHTVRPYFPMAGMQMNPSRISSRSGKT